MKTRLVRAATALIAGLALTACGTSTTPVSAPAPAPARTAAPAYDTDDNATTTSRHELTETAIDLTWDNSTPTDQRNMCNGITLFGVEWAATELRNGAGGDDTTLDWDYAAELIEGKCGL